MRDELEPLRCDWCRRHEPEIDGYCDGPLHEAVSGEMVCESCLVDAGWLPDGDGVWHGPDECSEQPT